MECSPQILPNLDTRNAFLAILPQESFREFLMELFLSATSLQALFFALSLHEKIHFWMIWFKYVSKQTNVPSERCHLLPTLRLSSGHDLLNRFQSSVMSCSTICIYKHSFQLHRCLFMSPHFLEMSLCSASLPEQ